MDISESPKGVCLIQASLYKRLSSVEVPWKKLLISIVAVNLLMVNVILGPVRGPAKNKF